MIIENITGYILEMKEPSKVKPTIGCFGRLYESPAMDLETAKAVKDAQNSAIVELGYKQQWELKSLGLVNFVKLAE